MEKVGVMMWPSWAQRASGLLGPCILEPAGPSDGFRTASDAFGRLRTAFGRLNILINAAMYLAKAEEVDSLLQATPLATPCVHKLHIKKH